MGVGVGVVGRETQSTVLLETVEILEREKVYWEEGWHQNDPRLDTCVCVFLCMYCSRVLIIKRQLDEP